MNVSLTYCMIMVFIGLAFALMAFLLFRVALLTNPSEKPAKNLLRALPGIVFAIFAMYIIQSALSGMPTTSQPERSAEVVPQKPNSSAGLPFVVGQVVVTKLPEFAFMHSDGGGMVKLEAVAAQTPSETPDKDSEKEDEWSVSEKETAPRDDKRPQGPEVVSAN